MTEPGVALPAFAPPRRERAADAVYAQLHDAIVGGRIPAGAHLSVPSLAQRFEVSRSPVREAVQRLIREGLAVEEPHRGARVVRLPPSELADLYQVRELLEGLAARLASARSKDDSLTHLRELVADHRSDALRGDERAALEADIQFHVALREASGNKALIEHLARLDGQVHAAMSTTAHAPGGGPLEAAKDHADILEAVLRGDGRRAEALARRHIRRLRAILAAT